MNDFVRNVCIFIEDLFMKKRNKSINITITIFKFIAMCNMFQHKLSIVMIHTFDSIGAHSSMSSATASKDLSRVIKTISNR